LAKRPGIETAGDAGVAPTGVVPWCNAR
jgi:hypothetical protein